MGSTTKTQNIHPQNSLVLSQLASIVEHFELKYSHTHRQEATSIHRNGISKTRGTTKSSLFHFSVKKSLLSYGWNARHILASTPAEREQKDFLNKRHTVFGNPEFVCVRMNRIVNWYYGWQDLSVH